MQKFKFFMEYMRVTQGYGRKEDGSVDNSSYSHAGSYALDLGGSDTGKDWAYAPCDIVVKRIYGNYNAVWFETLEENRNKRCFLFEHIPPIEGCGDGLNIYPYTKLDSSYKSTVFKSLLRHYHNVIFFHGHTHMKFYLQKYSDMANYDYVFGCHGVHIPSLAVPRDTNGTSGYTTVYADSEGYLVDVYEDGIHLRGRDFIKGEFLPIASYWLDTTLQTVEAGTYTDPTGTITT